VPKSFYFNLKKKRDNLQSQLLTAAASWGSCELDQQLQTSAGAAVGLRVRFQQVFTLFWSNVVALEHAEINFLSTFLKAPNIFLIYKSTCLT
jgi:hypothetical protein